VSRRSLLVAGIWAINLAGLVLIAAILAGAYLMRPTNGRPDATPVNTATRTAYLPPPTGTLYYLPTVTRGPYDPIFVPTFTPVAPLARTGAEVVGTSVAGRPLEVFTFGSGLRRYMIIAGIHGGNEWNTIALADELIAFLNINPDVIPPDLTLYILRSMNPDGEMRARNPDGRVNDNGVDLNRNFPHNWAAEWDRDGCWDLRPTTSGPYPGSEPETRAVMNFLAARGVEALISYHSAALGIFAGGIPPDASSLRLAEAVAAVSDYPFPPIDTGCIYNGNLTDWASDRGIAAIDIELTDHTHTDFEQNLRILDVFLRWRR